jgi:hypothetical protein
VADLAQFALAAGTRASTYVVGDEEPARHLDVVRYVCRTYGVPMPGFVPLDGVPRCGRTAGSTPHAPGPRSESRSAFRRIAKGCRRRRPASGRGERSPSRKRQ